MQLETYIKTLQRTAVLIGNRLAVMNSAIFRFLDKPYIKYPILVISGAILSVAIAVTAFFLLVLNEFFAPIPERDELKSIHHAESSIIYGSDETELGRYYLVNRVKIEYEEISEHYIDALIATEDARFYDHGGVDIRSMFRVLFKSIILGDRSAGGGSTISQQLAKNLYPRKDFGAWSIAVNKFREMIIAGRIEEFYDKEEILLLYLNTVPFSDNTYGIEVASRRFFGRHASEVSLAEAATIIGMLKATSIYNPRTQPDLAIQRRNLVLSRMLQHNYIERPLFDSLSILPLNLNYTMDDFREGPARYFRVHVAEELKNWARSNPRSDGSQYNIYTDGLRIFTTLNPVLQQYAEEAVLEHMTALQKDFDRHWKNDTLLTGAEINALYRNTETYRSLRSAGMSDDEIFAHAELPRPVPEDVVEWAGDSVWTALDSLYYFYTRLNTGFLVAHPHDGSILAWVGGIDFERYMFDHIKASRQVGSTYKPAVYATALAQGYEPCMYMPNRLITYRGYRWTPGNADGKYGGYYSMKGALAHSINTIAVQMIFRTGVDSVREMTSKLGVKTEVPSFPSISLGAADIPLLDMAQMYATFANQGVHTSFRTIRRIEDRFGNVLYQHTPDTSAPQQAMDKDHALMMTHMLTNAIDSGTGRRLRFRYNLRLPIAGKTGTTQGHADGWFIGYTPDVIGGVWVGGADRRIRFRTLNLGQGANMALPIWGLFMQKALANEEYAPWQSSRFPELDSVQTAMLHCRMYSSTGMGAVLASGGEATTADQVRTSLIESRRPQSQDISQPRQAPTIILRPGGTSRQQSTESEQKEEERPGLFRRIFGRNNDNR